MKLPELPQGYDTRPFDYDGAMFTPSQMLQFQADTIDAVLHAAYDKAKLFGQTGEVMWISIKSAVRHEQKGLK